jgi:methionyl-tRNA synthetase
LYVLGTDEHGTKIQQAAAKANMPLPDYCTSVSDEYRSLFKDFDVGFTDFVRTTEKRHKNAVKHFWVSRKWPRRWQTIESVGGGGRGRKL